MRLGWIWGRRYVVFHMGEVVAFKMLMDLSLQQMGETPSGLQKTTVPDGRVAEAIGGGAPAGGGGGGGADDDLQARLDSLRR